MNAQASIALSDNETVKHKLYASYFIADVYY